MRREHRKRRFGADVGSPPAGCASPGPLAGARRRGPRRRAPSPLPPRVVAPARGFARPALLAVALALPAGVAADEPPQVLVVVRSGVLAEEEVSPRSGAGTPVLWRLTRAGTTFASILSPPALAEDPRALLRSLLAAAARGTPDASPDVVEDDVLRGNESALEPRPELSRAEVTALRELREAVGRPPAPTDAERLFIERCLAVLGESRRLPADGGEPPATDVRAADYRTAALQVRLVRVIAYGASAAEVTERDELLERWRDAAGADVRLLVLDMPREGKGRLLVQGPGVPAGRVYTRARSWRILAEIMDAFAQYPEDVEEAIDGLLR